MNAVSFRERRLSPRQAGSQCEWVVATLVRPGHEVLLVDLSGGGALIECAPRLMPGSVIDLHLLALDRRHTIRSRVLRCAVSAVNADEGVRYRAALRFDHPFTGPGRSSGACVEGRAQHRSQGPAITHSATPGG